MRSNIKRILMPLPHDKRLPRKIKKSFKKWKFGWYSSHNWHGIYKAEKKCGLKSSSKVIRRGNQLWQKTKDSKK